MHIKDINKLLNLQDINIVKISDVYEDTIEITLEPLNYIQSCPCCNNKNVIRKGHSYNTGIHDLRNETLLHLVKGRKKNLLFNTI